MTKKFLLVFVSLLLMACSPKLEGTYSNNMTGIAEQKLSVVFSPEGTYRMSIGSTQVPLEIPYRVSGNKVIAGDDEDIKFTILDDGDLLIKGVRLAKETTASPKTKAAGMSSISKPAPAAVESKLSASKNIQEKDLPYCRQLAAKTRAAKPGDFAGDPDFLSAVSSCYKIAKEAGEVLVFTSESQ